MRRSRQRSGQRKRGRRSREKRRKRTRRKQKHREKKEKEEQEKERAGQSVGSVRTLCRSHDPASSVGCRRSWFSVERWSS